jgi:hypothetical protein
MCSPAQIARLIFETGREWQRLPSSTGMQQAEKPATIALRTLVKRDVEFDIILTARAHFGFKKELTIIE